MRIVWKLLKFLEIINVRFFSKNEFSWVICDGSARETYSERNRFNDYYFFG